jgi:hypothetical protein
MNEVQKKIQRRIPGRRREASLAIHCTIPQTCIPHSMDQYASTPPIEVTLMETQQEKIVILKSRSYQGCYLLIRLSAVVLAFVIALTYVEKGVSANSRITLKFAAPIAFYCLMQTIWFTMRNELRLEQLALRNGPVLRYRTE